MDRLRLAFVLLAVAIPATGPAAAPAAGPPATAAEKLLAAINDTRSRAGSPPLALSPALARSSETYGRRLMRGGMFRHSGAIPGAGGFRRLGEALALHRGHAVRPGRTVRRWLASPGHGPLLLSHAFRHAGAAAIRGRFQGRPSTIWVLRLGGR